MLTSVYGAHNNKNYRQKSDWYSTAELISCANNKKAGKHKSGNRLEDQKNKMKVFRLK